MLAAVLLPSFASAAIAGPKPSPTAASRTVVFVCEHGNVKSLIASEWFNRLAAARGFDLRSVSRGVTPGAAVPPGIADALRNDGFDVTRFKPQAFDAAAASGAVRVVGIGVDLSSMAARGAALETWAGIPPASERYAASRDALRARVETLLDKLENAGRRR